MMLRRFSRCSAYAAFARIFGKASPSGAGSCDQVNAILNCHLATGRIGKPGASPFCSDRQPNAMGGREVGVLAITARIWFSRRRTSTSVRRSEGASLRDA